MTFHMDGEDVPIAGNEERNRHFKNQNYTKAMLNFAFR